MIAIIRSGEMLLRHVGEVEAAEAVRQALLGAYTDAIHLTSDLGGSASTSAFSDHLVERVERRMANA